jgi:hypothetical protein
LPQSKKSPEEPTTKPSLPLLSRDAQPQPEKKPTTKLSLNPQEKESEHSTLIRGSLGLSFGCFNGVHSQKIKIKEKGRDTIG